MLTENKKKAIYNWRNAHRDEYLYYLSEYNTMYRMKNKEKELERGRIYRTFQTEAKRLRNILI